MHTLRCTQKLLRSGVRETAEPLGPTTSVLGDWYANVLFSRPQRLVVCVSEVTLLPVVLPASPAVTLAGRLPQALAEVLQRIGVAPDAIRTEIGQMSPAAVGRTANRRVLGTLNQFLFQLEVGTRFPEDRNRSTLELSLWLAGTPCSALDGTFPDRVTRARLD